MLWRITLSAADPEELGAELIDEGALGSHLVSEHQLDLYCELPNRAELDAWLEMVLAHRNGSILHVEPVEQEPWVQRCEELMQPVKAGRLTVVPVFGERSRPERSQDELHLVPGLGFGTGHHPTTAMLLTILSEVVEKERPHSCFDWGTGSGVLGIASILLGTPWAVGCDLDRDALSNAEVNAVLNGVEDRFFLVQSDGGAFRGHFPLVCANLYSSLLIELSQALIDCLLPGGTLLLSGIQVGELPEVKKMFAFEGINLIGEQQQEGWASLHLQQAQQ